MAKQKPTIWLTDGNKIRTDADMLPVALSDHKPQMEAIHGETPLSLMTMPVDRDFMKRCINEHSGLYPGLCDDGISPYDEDEIASDWEGKRITIQRRALDALYTALADTEKAIPCIKDLTDFELIAQVDEVGSLVARKDTLVFTEEKHNGGTNNVRLELKAGEKYRVGVLAAGYRKAFIRKKVSYSREHGLSCEDHDMELVGKDTIVRAFDHEGRECWFRNNPHERDPRQFHDSSIWEYFEKPDIPTVKEVYKSKYDSYMDSLDLMEMIEGFKYYPGQKDYIARTACTDSVLISAETGCGKTLMAISLMELKGAKKVCVIAPKGTVDGDEYDHAQWNAEMKSFAPSRTVYELFSSKDYYRILDENGGELPDGVYITYPNAMFRNEGAFETVATVWSPREYEEKTRKKLGIPQREEGDPNDDITYSHGVGKTEYGYREIWKPSLATIIGDVWDMVVLDEAHLICNQKSQVTQALIRMQPQYRIAMSATPIPNMAYNLFPLLGWLMVPKWFHGNNMNPAWPFRIDDIGSFKDSFLSKEYDRTAELQAAQRGQRKSCVKDSPVISQPARLLKLLKPGLAYISKEDCNPDLVKCNTIVTRVPMGRQQLDAYAHYIQPENIPYRDPKNRAAVQQNWLRSICGGPLGLKFVEDNEDLTVTSNYNPKTVMVMEKIRECLERKEQAVVIYARLHQGDEIASRLTQAGVDFCRIDSTKPKHAKEAAIFKKGKKPIMLMGIACAQAYSFSQASNLIIASLEWSYGKLNQAMGRVYRLNSPRDVNVYCILHKDTIEELVFDKLCTKQDAATICLKGEFVSNDIDSVHPDEIMADHVMNFNRNAANIEEAQCELEWPALQKGLSDAINGRREVEVAADEAKLDPVSV